MGGLNMQGEMQPAALLRLVRRLRGRLTLTRLLRAGCTGLWWSAPVLAAAVILDRYWLPLDPAFALLPAAVPLVAGLLAGALRGRPTLNEVARLADRRLQARGLLLSAWDLARTPGSSETGARSLVLGRAMASLPGWRSATRLRFPIVRPQTLPLAVVVNGAALVALLLPGPLPGADRDHLSVAGAPALPWPDGPAPAAPQPADRRVPDAARDAQGGRGAVAAADPRPSEGSATAGPADDRSSADPSSDRHAAAGRPGITGPSALSGDRPAQARRTAAADQVGSAAPAANVAGRPDQGADLITRYVDLEWRVAGRAPADATAPGGELGEAHDAPTGSAAAAGPPPASPPRLATAHDAMAPALQAFVADYLSRTQAGTSP